MEDKFEKVGNKLENAGISLILPLFISIGIAIYSTI